MEDTDEPDNYNNTSFQSFRGLLAKSDGEKFTEDTSLEVNTDDQGQTDGYTVYADLQNNSMQPVNIGIPVAVLLDSEGNVLAQKNLQSEELTLGKEQRYTNLSASFAASEIRGTPVRSDIRHIYKVSFDVKGGTGTFDELFTDLDGHIKMPGTTPAPPADETNTLYFNGWYTDKTGGERITGEYTFTESCMVYARYSTEKSAQIITAENVSVTYGDDGRNISATVTDPETGGARSAMPSRRAGRITSMWMLPPVH